MDDLDELIALRREMIRCGTSAIDIQNKHREVGNTMSEDVVAIEADIEMGLAVKNWELAKEAYTKKIKERIENLWRESCLQ
jgi:uncharacterized membrane-anchored protein